MPRVKASTVPSMEAEVPKVARIVPTVNDLAQSQEKLRLLQNECLDFLVFMEDVPNRIVRERTNYQVLIHDIQTRCKSFSKACNA